MPFRTYLTAHSVPRTLLIDILVSTQHQDAEMSTSTDCFAAEFGLAAARRQQLFGMIREDQSSGEQIQDEIERGRIFLAAAGMNPEFPWDE
eukprot:1192109-Rhodomonas_salina.1